MISQKLATYIGQRLSVKDRKGNLLEITPVMISPTDYIAYHTNLAPEIAWKTIEDFNKSFIIVGVLKYREEI